MRARAEVVAFGVAMVCGWLLASALGLSPAQPAAAAQGAAPPQPPGAAAMEASRILLRQGSEHLRRDRVEAAVIAYRKAWRVPALRDEAARALRDIQRRPDASLSVDEEALSKTAALLGAGFIRHESDHFVILSDAGRDWTLGKAALLERAHHQFFRVMDRLEYPAIPPENKLQCVLFREHAMYMAFARAHDGVEAPWIAGYYAGLSNRVVFYDDRTGPSFTKAFEQIDEYERSASSMLDEARKARRNRQSDLAENLAARAEEMTRRVDLERGRLREQAASTSDAKTIHEAVHLLAFNCGVQSRAHQYPFWITEGLAVSFETETPDAAFGPDHGSETRRVEFQANLDSRRLFELDPFVQLNAPPDRDAATADVMYSQSYALFASLHRYERRALAGYLLDMWAEPPGPVSPRRHLQMFAARFGDPAAVERRWLRREAE